MSLSRRWLIGWCVFGLVCRIGAILLCYGGYDVENFEVSAQIAARGGNIYLEQFYYNYSPVPAHLLIPITWLPAPYSIWHRLFLTAFDAINAVLIAGLAGRRSVGLIYWLNPAAILLVAMCSQMEVIALSFLLAAALASVRNKRGVWALATCALLVKHIVVFLVLALFLAQWGWKRGGLRFGASLAIFAASFIPYLPAAAPHIVERVLRYQSWTEIYGLGLVLPPGLGAAVFFAGMAVMVVGVQWQTSD